MCNRCRHRNILRFAMRGLADGCDFSLNTLATTPDHPSVYGEDAKGPYTVEERALTFRGVRAVGRILAAVNTPEISPDEVKAIVEGLAPEERSEAIDFFGLLHEQASTLATVLVLTKHRLGDTDRPEDLAQATAKIQRAMQGVVASMMQAREEGIGAVNPLGVKPIDPTVN